MSSLFNKDIGALGAIEKKLTGLISRKSRLSYEETLDRLGLFPAESRKVSSDLIEAYQI